TELERLRAAALPPLPGPGVGVLPRARGGADAGPPAARRIGEQRRGGGGRRRRQARRHRASAAAAWQVVADGCGEDHRGHGGPRDAQRGAQRNAPVRPDPGLRAARARTPGRARRGRPRGAARGPVALRAATRTARAAHLRGAADRAGKRGGRYADAVARGIFSGARMSSSTPQIAAGGSRERTRSCATGLVCHRCELEFSLREPVFACPDCGKDLDVAYDYELAARHSKDVPRAQRPMNIWRFEELLPIVDASAQARVGSTAGQTPLIYADRLGAEPGLSNLYLKDDSTSRPSLSYKDRVVAMSVARLLELGGEEIGCVSTGNVGTAVASYAAKAGVDAYVFYPNRLEDTKARACRALGAKVCQVEGNYDEAHRCCREIAAATGMDFANLTLRPFYAEGAKTAALETVGQLEWQAPAHIVTAAAGGTLSSRQHKGLGELQLLGLAETDPTH